MNKSIDEVKTREKCPVCGHNEFNLVHEGRDLLMKIPGSFSLMMCSYCGLVRTEPILNSVEMQAYYPNDYLPYYKALSTEKNPLIRWFRKKGTQEKCNMVIRASEGSGANQILDVGCATGIFLDGMKKRGWEVKGVEPSSFAAEYASEKYKIEVKNSYVVPGLYPANSFDVITLWDVFEHMPNPREILTTLHDWIKPGGLILITTPNSSSSFRKQFNESWAGWDTPRHYFIYNAQNLQDLLSDEHYSVVGRFGGIGEFGHYLLSLRFGLENRKVNPLRRVVKATLNSFLGKAIVYPLFITQFDRKNSSSMTIVARKID